MDILFIFFRVNWKVGQGSSSTTLCCCHFTVDQFDNYNMWANGMADRLRLKKCAVPSVIDISENMKWFNMFSQHPSQQHKRPSADQGNEDISSLLSI